MGPRLRHRRYFGPFAPRLGRTSHRRTDNLGQVTDEIADCLLQSIDVFSDAINFSFDAIDFSFDAINFSFDAIETCLDARQIVGIVTRLFKNVASDHLLALNLTFEHADARFKLFPGHVCGHSATPDRSRRLTQFANFFSLWGCFGFYI